MFNSDAQIMTERPNVLLICVDQWPAQFMGCAGNSSILTPGLDEIAACGVRYTNAYSESPVCTPARRSLMTGMSPRSHGVRSFDERAIFPNAPTLAGAFRQAGYQTTAVGKLHVIPQRARIGFDDVILDEEGRNQFGVIDDYDIYLGDQGLAGRQFEHGMSNNQYHWRPWHLDEAHHPTAWAGRQMARTIQRRDPTRPALWYLGFRHPHPPLVPPQAYLDMYARIEPDLPDIGDWSLAAELPFPIKALQGNRTLYSDQNLQQAKRAFYALCTQIDHQIRYVIGTLRQEGVLDNTIIMFTSDHGEMLGDHNMLGKQTFYEGSTNIPMIVMPNKDNPRVPTGDVDDRLVAFCDVMPTLLDLAKIDIPDSVDGVSMHQGKRNYIYGECREGDHATRMIREERWKLIWYPVGNYFQLFDIEDDRQEHTDLARDPAHSHTLARLQLRLLGELYGDDLLLIDDATFIGAPDRPNEWTPDRGLNSQRGAGWPSGPVRQSISEVSSSLQPSKKGSV